MADEMRQTLDIPNGTTFEFKDDKLIFGHESDIHIRTNMGGYAFRKIFSKTGNVLVDPPEGVELEVDEIEALDGDIFLNGRVKAARAKAQTVHFQEGHLVADRIEGSKEVVLSGKHLDVLHVKAPKVSLDGDSEGTCLVVECENDLGHHRARGGFRSLAEARSTFERFQGAGAPPAGAPSRDESKPTEVPDRPQGGAATEEFRAARREEAQAGAQASGSPSLPKSSVFRKRK